ncbi:hypothetical protein GCM10027190_50990 [Spirosoma areae]
MPTVSNNTITNTIIPVRQLPMRFGIGLTVYLLSPFCETGMAEIELSVLQRDCLNRHIATKDELVREVNAWQTKRNHRQAKANWQFTNKEARIKLHKLYPTT